jgi:ubiquinone/menaquinone biosynthesis C-methylase UbiE
MMVDTASQLQRSSATKPERFRWVPETRFGYWFLGTNVWSRYVVEVALAELKEMLPDSVRRPERILDAGCGPGVSLPMLEHHFSPKEIIGMDIDPKEIARAKRLAASCRCRVEIRRGDAKAIDLPDASVDLVLCHQLLHHVVDQEGVLKELHRVLAPGGALLVAESCRAFILTAPVRLLFRHPNEVQKSAEEYAGLVRAAGFEFSANQVKTSLPFWSQTDWGLGVKVGLRKGGGEPTQVCIAAVKPKRAKA